MYGGYHLALGDRRVWNDIWIAIAVPVGKVVDDQTTPRSWAVTALDAGVVVFCCDTPISEDDNVCR